MGASRTTLSFQHGARHSPSCAGSSTDKEREGGREDRTLDTQEGGPKSMGDVSVKLRETFWAFDTDVSTSN